MADAELDAQRIAFIINHRKQVLLAGHRLELGCAAEVGVVLERHRPSFGKIVRPVRRGREGEGADAFEGVSRIGLVIRSTGPMRPPMIGRISPELRVGSQYRALKLSSKLMP